MKKSLLITLVAICMATPAFADGGIIGVFADQAGTNCSVSEPIGFGYIYIVHLTTTGSNGSGAKALKPGCAPGQIVGDAVERIKHRTDGQGALGSNPLELLVHLRGAIAGDDDEFGDATVGKSVDLTTDQRAATNIEQGLGNIRR